MKNFLPSLMLIFIFQTISAQIPAWQGVSPSRLLIVYNTLSPDNDGNGKTDSRDLAEYYQAKRNVPAANLLGIAAHSSSGGGYIYYYTGLTQWQEMWDEMIQPIKNKLTALGDTSILYILMCDPLPHTFIVPTDAVPATANDTRSIDALLQAINDIGSRNVPKAFPNYWENHPVFDVYPGMSDNTMDYWQFNHIDFKQNGTNMYLVSRLMNSSQAMNINLIDMALYADKYVYKGNGYYNGVGYLDNQGGKYTAAEMAGSPSNANNSTLWDKNIYYADTFFAMAGLRHKVETSVGSNVIGSALATYKDGSPAAYADSAFMYTGWYNFGQYMDKWNWIPGSVACDLNSNSGQDIRIESGTFSTNAFLKGAFYRGLTCGTGVLGEPYLQGHPRGDLLLYYMLAGYNFIEAAGHSDPSIKWQSITVGDPLYNPFNPYKTPAIDNVIQPSVISYNFVNSTSTDVKLDYDPTEAAPEVVKANLYYGTSSGIYTDTIHADSLYFAHHKFKLTGLNNTTTYFYKICVKDPVNNLWCSLENSFQTNGTVITGSAVYTDKLAELKVYPNPTQNLCYFQHELKKTALIEITLMNMLGEIVYLENKPGYAGMHVGQLQLNELPAGLYMLQVRSDDVLYSKIISKQ